MATRTIEGLEGGWQFSDVKMIKLACDVASLAAVKEAKRGSLTKDDLFNFRAIINSIIYHITLFGPGTGCPKSINLTHLQEVEQIELSTLKNSINESNDIFSKSYFLKPYFGFEKLFTNPPIDQFIGDTKIESNDNIIYMINTGIQLNASSTVLQLISLLENTVYCADKIKNKASISALSIPMHQICVLIENLFTNLLPRPSKLENGPDPNRYLQKSPFWGNVKMSIEQQRRCLHHINELSLRYMSASYSLPQDRSIESVRSTTLFAMLMYFDTLLRIELIPADGSDEHLQKQLIFSNLFASKRNKPYWLSTNGFDQNNSLKLQYSAMILLHAEHVDLLQHVIEYFTESEVIKDGVSTLFDWKADVERLKSQFRVESEDPTLRFITELLEMKQIKQEGGEVQPYEDLQIPEVESKFAKKPVHTTPQEEAQIQLLKHKISWYCSTKLWSDIECPEFTEIRNIVFLARLSLEPMSKFLKKNPSFSGLKLYNTHQFQSSWKIRTVQPASVLCGVTVNKQDNFCIGIEKLKSPRDVDRFIPPVSSAIPSQPHALALLFSGGSVNKRGGGGGGAPGGLGGPGAFGGPRSQHFKNTETSASRHVAEEDVQQVRELPKFGRCLDENDTERLISLLTSSTITIPLMLDFFDNQKIDSLLHPELRNILESILFEPKYYIYSPNKIAKIPVPHEERTKSMGSPYGLLSQELTYAPDTTLYSIYSLISQANKLCTGDYLSKFADLLLFIIRITVRILRVRLFIEKNYPAKKQFFHPSTYFLETMNFLEGNILTRLCELEKQSDKNHDITRSVNYKSHIILIIDLLQCCKNDYSYLLDKFLLTCCYVVSWHSKSNENDILANKDDPNFKLMIPVHNKHYEDPVETHSPLFSIPIYDIFYIIERNRAFYLEKIQSKFSKESLFALLTSMAYIAMNFNENQQQKDHSLEKSAESKSKLNKKQFQHLIYANQCWEPLESEQQLPTEGEERVNRQSISYFGIYKNQSLGIQVNLQTAEVYFGSRLLIPTPRDILHHHDFQELIPSSADPYCAIISNLYHRRWIQVLYNSNCYQVFAWTRYDNSLNNQPTIGWHKDNDESISLLPSRSNNHSLKYRNKSFVPYTPGEFGDHWFFQLFEQILFEQCKKIPRENKLKIYKYPLNEEESKIENEEKRYERYFNRIRKYDVQLLYSLNRLNDYIYYEVQAYPDKECIHSFVLLEFGRRIRKSLVFTSDYRWCLHFLQPPMNDRILPAFPSTEYSSGNLFNYFYKHDGEVFQSVGYADFPESNIGTIVIQRNSNGNLTFDMNELNSNNIHTPRNENLTESNDSSANIIEEYIPKRFLFGIVPDCLIETFDFWLVESENIIYGYFKSSPEENHESSWLSMKEWGYLYKIIIELSNSSDSSVKEENQLHSSVEEKLLSVKESGQVLIRRVPINPEYANSVELDSHECSNNNEEMVLLNLLQSKKESVLGIIALQMIELDSLSHILLWSRSKGKINDEVEISIIELPRLKLRFSMKKSADNRMRLYSLDHDDLFISERYSKAITEKFTNSLLHGILMENRFAEQFLLVPSYGLHGIQIQSCPLSTTLVSYRSDKEWRKHVKAPYYIYPIHQSGSFLVITSMASALYMIILRLLRRDYVQAARLITNSLPDSAFTAEESWILSHVKKTESDSHPDAHACRLRLALICIEHSPNTIDWSVEEDLHNYLQKYSHVSSDCRLSYNEERLLIEHLKQKDNSEPSTKIRWLYLQAVERADQTSATEKVEIPHPMPYGGSHLRTLYIHANQTIKQQFVEQSCHLFFNYQRPSECREDGKPTVVKGLKAFEILQQLWDDNMYGQKWRTGFFLLYEMLLGRIHFQLTDTEDEPDADEFQPLEPMTEEKLAKMGTLTENDYDMLRKINKIDTQEGCKYRTKCFNLAKLLVYSLYFRFYVSGRGLPAETSTSFTVLSLVVSMIQCDPEHKFLSWRLPSMPYKILEEKMKVVRPNAPQSLRQGFWGDRSEGLADEFENLLTTGVSIYNNTEGWRRNPVFSSSPLEFSSFYSEYGNPYVFRVQPNWSDCRPEIDDFSCDARVIKPIDTHLIADLPESEYNLSLLNLTSSEIKSFSGIPLDSLDLEKYIVHEYLHSASSSPSSPSVERMDPLKEIRKQAFSSTMVADNIIRRIETDIEQYECARSSSKYVHLKCLQQEKLNLLRKVLCESKTGENAGENDDKSLKIELITPILQETLSDLGILYESLIELQKNDNLAILAGVPAVEQLANQFPIEPTREELEHDETNLVISKICFLLQRQAGQKPWLHFDLLCRALMSPNSHKELNKFNPFLYKKRCNQMLVALSGILFRSVRLSQANNCIASTTQLISTVKNILKLIIQHHIHVSFSNQKASSSLSSSINPSPIKIPYSPILFSFILSTTRYNISEACTLFSQMTNHYNQLIASIQSHFSAPPSSNSGALATSSPSRQLSFAEIKQFAFILFHFCNFDISECYSFLSSMNDNIYHLLDLANRKCYYHGKFIFLPSTPARPSSPGRSTDRALSRTSVSSSSSEEDENKLDQEREYQETLSKMSETLHLIQHTAETLATNLSECRYYTSILSPSSSPEEVEKKQQKDEIRVKFDPRYLVFEFVSNILLRKRQVELVNDFVNSAKEGKSSVHQMIMGAGKTTVICPLLSLLLADGQSLITQIVPSALLDMSRSILRSCFSNIIMKRVYSFDFDRYSASQSQDLLIDMQRLYTKLDVARKQRSVVCTTPESIKSLMLMYLDLLSTIETNKSELQIIRDQINRREQQKKEASDSGAVKEEDDDEETAESIQEKIKKLRLKRQQQQNQASVLTTTERETKLELALEIEKKLALQKKVNKDENTADQIRNIILLWGKKENGIALLDEVDSVLHPLYSELNFPIGDKKLLPNSPERWRIAFHLFDGLFYNPNSSCNFSTSTKKPSEYMISLLNDIHHVILHGKNNLSLQSSPHTVLLEKNFYNHNLKTLLSKWAIVYLELQSSIQLDLQKANYSKEIQDRMFEYISGFDYENDPLFVNQIETLFAEKSIELLQMARLWLCSYLPHCLSKINRVHFGLLHQHDMERWDELYSINLADSLSLNIPRNLLSIPFLGKDVPSQSSEFAHPDVLIGLTILSYRYEGLRESDIISLIKTLKQQLSLEPGPYSERPSNILFQDWISIANVKMLLIFFFQFLSI